MHNNSEYVLRPQNTLIKTICNGIMFSKDHHVDNQELAENPTGSWTRLIKKMAYMSKDTDTSKSVNKTEDCSPH